MCMCVSVHMQACTHPSANTTKFVSVPGFWDGSSSSGLKTCGRAIYLQDAVGSPYECVYKLIINLHRHDLHILLGEGVP